jgi:hypothetical protein
MALPYSTTDLLLKDKHIQLVQIAPRVLAYQAKQPLNIAVKHSVVFLHQLSMFAVPGPAIKPAATLARVNAYHQLAPTASVHTSDAALRRT